MFVFGKSMHKYNTNFVRSLAPKDISM